MVVQLTASTGPVLGLEGLRSVAEKLINREVFVGWPHLGEALAISVCGREYEYTEKGSQMNDARRFSMQLKFLTNQ